MEQVCGKQMVIAWYRVFQCKVCCKERCEKCSFTGKESPETDKFIFTFERCRFRVCRPSFRRHIIFHVSHYFAPLSCSSRSFNTSSFFTYWPMSSYKQQSTIMQ